MEADVACAFMQEAEKIVYLKLVIIRQQKRFTSERCTVYHFSLLVTYCSLDDADNELRSFVVELILRIVKIPEEAFDALLQFDASSLPSVSYSLGIVENIVPVSPR